MAAKRTQAKPAPVEEPAPAERTPLVGDQAPELPTVPEEDTAPEGCTAVEETTAADDAAAEHDAVAAEQTTDYTRCGGHVLTDKGWIPEDLVEALGATRTRIDS